MKIPPSLITVLLAAIVLTLTACSKSGSTVDASPLEKSFASAEATVKSAADKAITAIKGADYSSATAELQKLASNVKLTDEQKKAVSDVLAQLQKAVMEAGNKAAVMRAKPLATPKRPSASNIDSFAWGR